MRYRDLEHKLISRSVQLHNGCWMWMGRVEPNGYAKIGVYEGGGRAKERVRNYWVHRVAWKAFNCVEIPEGYDVDHTCDFPLCINPAHLNAVPLKVNRSRGAVNGNKKRGYC